MAIRMAGGGGGGGSPLDIYLLGGSTQGGQNTTSANTMDQYGIVIPYAVKFGHLGVLVITDDAASNSDVGIYNAAGTALLANIGAQAISATGWQAFPIVQSSVTLQPGRYIIAFTSVGGVLGLSTDGHFGLWCFAFSTGSTSGGALPSSITPPAFGLSASGCLMFALYT